MDSSKKYSVLGVMSGTSLDGIDFCWVEFIKENQWSFQIKETYTSLYSSQWKKQLQSAHLLNEEELCKLNTQYTAFLGKQILAFIHSKSISDLDLVASHGHTVLHQPENGLTLQIGNLPQIAKQVGLPVVCDFRVQDVALGGQGAPLVPLGDQLLFGEFDACLNLGGFANISFEVNKERIAYDICPVNIALNYFAEKIGLDYDKDGKIARQNAPHLPLLEELNQLNYYQSAYPKSLGKEWVEADFLPLVFKYRLEPQQIMSTLTHHAAFQIKKNVHPSHQVCISGGGGFNSYLLSLMQSGTSAQFVLPSENIINYKEALIFGLLGVLRFRDEVNVLASVTGASKNHSSGQVYFPN